jgi:hypothetical protein
MPHGSPDAPNFPFPTITPHNQRHANLPAIPEISTFYYFWAREENRIMRFITFEMDKRRFTDTRQFGALARIAVFCAALRGHRLGGWIESEDSATALCATCNSAVTVRRSVFEPTLDGRALEVECRAQVIHTAA